MRPIYTGISLLALSFACVSSLAAGHPSAAAPGAAPAKSSASPAASGWDKAAAAKYLDDREVWWQEWPHAQKDHGTVCVSCHTQVPYALARPALRAPLGEHAASDPERAMLDSIITRVNLGDQAETFYSDAVHGPGKTKEARNAEAVNNAVILASYDAARAASDAASGTVYRKMPGLQAASLKAFSEMWALQEQSGPKAGAWLWQNFHFSPWEAPESEYWGAAMAAVATGIAPGNYREEPSIQPNLALLRGCLKREAPAQPLINRVALLWASSKLSGLLTDPERAAIVTEILSKQQLDGGWCLTTMGQEAWKRHDTTPFDTRSDGYATGFTVLALEESGMPSSTLDLKRGLSWLVTSQSKPDGDWPAWSVNVERDPSTGVGKFMSDAATGFSVLALEKSR
jgi:squalene-hopene/tetraprenyl-beta-curcumene cyclase